jgi:TonB family protein
MWARVMPGVMALFAGHITMKLLSLIALIAALNINPLGFAGSQENKNSNKPKTSEDRVYKSNEVTKVAVILSKPKAEDTAAARKNRISGTVALWAVLRASGEVTNIRVNVGLPDGLTQQAINGARKIKFTPAEKDDRKVSVLAKLEYRFVCDPSCRGAP